MSIRPRLIGGPLSPPVADGCVVKVAALAGAQTVDVLVPRELNRCDTIRLGQRVKIEAELVPYWCEIDWCRVQLSLFALKLSP